MLERLTACCLLATTFCTAAAAGGAEFATPREARAMLDRAVSAVRADQRAALDTFNHNAAGFRDRDLFVFCFDARNGKFTAHEALSGQDVRMLRDTTGQPFGEEMYRSAPEGRVAEVRYHWPIPGSTRIAVRDAYVTRAGDQVCGVSVYKDQPNAD